MDPLTPTINEAYLRYADLLLRYQCLLAQGKQDTEEAESLEEEMNKAWEPLDSVQRKSLSGLASDLNWVRDKGAPPPRGPRAEEVSPEDFQAVVKAKNDKDWHLMLHLLRLCSPRIPVFHLAWLRGGAWEELKLPRIASWFYNFAAQLEPGHGPAAIVALQTLKQIDAGAAISRAQEVLENEYRHPPVVVIFSAAMLLQNAEKERRAIDRAHYARLVGRALERLRLLSGSDMDQAITYQFATFCYWILEEWEAALQSCEDGLRSAQDNKWLLLCKGLFLYGRKTDEAVEALERAARVPTDADWPCYFLAHHHLLQKQFAKCLSFCSQALPGAESDSVKAELLEWSAISESALAYPEEVVSSLFRKALELDPTNERIRRNLQIFESSRGNPVDSGWDVEAEESLRRKRTSEARHLPHLAA